MQDLRNVIAKRAILKQVEEREDPLLVYTMVDQRPELREGIKVCPYTDQEGQFWNAYLLFIDAREGCCFYKHCLRKGCKSLTDAQLIAEYSQETAMITCPQSSPSNWKLKLNLN